MLEHSNTTTHFQTTHDHKILFQELRILDIRILEPAGRKAYTATKQQPY